MDIFKCTVFYNRAYDNNELKIILGTILARVEYITIIIDTTINKILDVNTAKLRKRYPVKEGYSDKAANNRDLEGEQKAMENITD